MTGEVAVGIIGVVASTVTAIVSWIVSARLTSKSLQRMELRYRTSSYKLVTHFTDLAANPDLRVAYKGEELSNPAIVGLTLRNVGNKAVVNPPIEVRFRGTGKLIPLAFEKVPEGYENKWLLGAVEADRCKLSVEHINPGQTLMATFLIGDGLPESVVVSCPMPDLNIKEEPSNKDTRLLFILETIAQALVLGSRTK